MRILLRIVAAPPSLSFELIFLLTNAHSGGRNSLTGVLEVLFGA